MMDLENEEIVVPETSPRPVERRRPSIAGQDIVERVFKDSANDYVTVLAISRRARQILDEYPKYEDRLEEETATSIALEEFLAGKITFTLAEIKDPAPK
jgi:DNA-directed RNA polymerase subunit K/omega